jgi:excisionase family DNA binding protein
LRKWLILPPRNKNNELYNISNGIRMEVITMESAAFKKLTEQLTEIVQYVRLAKMAFQENLTGKGLKPMLTNDDAAKMLGVSKRTLQRMRSENRIDFIKIGNQCRYQVEAIERMVEERTITKET